MPATPKREFVHDLPELSRREIPGLLAMAAYENSVVWCGLLCVQVVRLSHEPLFAIMAPLGQWQRLRFESTPTGFNGRRWWLVCPSCDRRAGALFWRNGSCACRRCLKLHYACQHESPLDRHFRRIRKARHAIWGNDEPDIDCLMRSMTSFKKPKGMHRETFRRKLWQLEDIEGNWMVSLYACLTAWNK